MVRASVLVSSVAWVRIPPEQRFFLFGEKELFGLVAFPFSCMQYVINHMQYVINQFPITYTIQFNIVALKVLQMAH